MVILVGGGVAAYALTRDGGGDGITGGGGTTSQAQAAGGTGGAQPAAGADAAPPATKEAVLAGLPPVLAGELEECKSSGETDNGGLQIQCRFKKGSLVVAGLTDPEFQSIIASVDVRQARKKVIQIRQKYEYSSTSAVNEVVENTNRTAAAMVNGPRIKEQFQIDYANSSTGVMVSFGDSTSLENAKTFMTRAGLMN